MFLKTDQRVRSKHAQEEKDMLSKFSVKKAYTVIVGIVLVIILGVVSLSKMSTDLLPSMNLPYAIVMTTYSGSSPGIRRSRTDIFDVRSAGHRSLDWLRHNPLYLLRAGA